MTTTTIKMPGTPKPWMNTAVRTMLRVPGLRRLLGRTFAVITVTGAKSGTKYSTPVQYLGHDGDVVVLSQSHRVWWRNVRTHPEVTLSVGAKTIRGKARIAEGDEAYQILSACLTDYPRVARFYGIHPEDDKTIDPDDVDRLHERVVAIVISPDRTDPGLLPPLVP